MEGVNGRLRRAATRVPHLEGCESMVTRPTAGSEGANPCQTGTRLERTSEEGQPPIEKVNGGPAFRSSHSDCLFQIADCIAQGGGTISPKVERSGMSTCASKNGYLPIAEKRNWMSPTSLSRTTARQCTNGCMIGNSPEKWYRARWWLNVITRACGHLGSISAESGNCASAGCPARQIHGAYGYHRSHRRGRQGSPQGGLTLRCIGENG